MKRKMTALVIGNAAYPDGQELTNPTHDAVDLGARLTSYGFDVDVVIDCSCAEMDKRLKAFRERLETHDIGLFFFAGHGIQIDGHNYLLATDTNMDSESDAKFSSLSLDKVVDAMAKSTAATKIVILDACRKNPWERNWHRAPGVRGLASVYAPKGTIIGFATSPGEVAYDGVGRNGTYTDALLQHIDTPDCSIESMFKRVRNTVAAASGGRQTTWEHTSLSGEFYFNMSLGELVTEYDGTVLADSLFVPDPSKASHRLITALKSYNWYTQNPALDAFRSEAANKMAKDSLFVIGRNIYQAACGSSDSATAFINNFMAVTVGFKPGRRKAVLDGMLFEIFFDARGELRPKIKKGLFEEVFDLQRYAELKESFDFIAEALTAAGGDYHAVPGKGHELAVTVATKTRKGEIFVDAIYVGGLDVLTSEEDEWGDIGGETIFKTTSPERLSKSLGERLAVPYRLLKVSYTPSTAAKADAVRVPVNWAVKKGPTSG